MPEDPGWQRHSSLPDGAQRRHKRTIAAAAAGHRYVKPLTGKTERGELDATFVITHRMPLEEAPAAYELLVNEKGGCVKGVLAP